MHNKNVIYVEKALNFKVELRYSAYYPTGKRGKLVLRPYAVIKGKNGEVVFTWEVRTNKKALLKTINRLFTGFNITEKPYQPQTIKK